MKRFDPIVKFRTGGAGVGDMQEVADGDYILFTAHNEELTTLEADRERLIALTDAALKWGAGTGWRIKALATLREIQSRHAQITG